MAAVTVKIGGRDYVVACDNGQEEHLRFLADEVDERLQSLVYQMKGQPGEAMGLLLTALMMADELIENKQKNTVSSHENARQDERLDELESAMAVTLDEIAQRIEKLADRVDA